MEGIDDKGNNPSDPLNRVMKHGLDFLSLTKDERFSGVLIGYRENEEGIFCPLRYRDNEGRDKFLLSVKTIFAAYDIREYGHLGEVWMRKPSRGEPISGNVRDFEDKKEAIVVTYISREKRLSKVFEKCENGSYTPMDLQPDTIMGDFMELLVDIKMSRSRKREVIRLAKKTGYIFVCSLKSVTMH